VKKGVATTTRLAMHGQGLPKPKELRATYQ